MAGDDRAVVQGRHLTPNGRAPPGVARVVLVGHARVADLAPVSELPPQAVEQLVVPFVVRARAAALNEQDLPGSHHDDPPSHLSRPVRYSAAGAKPRAI